MLASALGRELIRLQCYEGLDEAKALYEWEYAKQLLYTQILQGQDRRGGRRARRRCARRSSASPSEDDVFFSDRFLLPRPLLRAITSPEPCVLLIDEIDKSDTEFEAFLLEVLSRLPGERARARHAARARTFRSSCSPATTRARCPTRSSGAACISTSTFPTSAQELEIVQLKVPGVGERLAGEVVVGRCSASASSI